MGTITGAIAGIILFSIYGLLPVFRFGSFLALFIMHKVTGRSVKPTLAARVFIMVIVILCLLSAAAFSLITGALIGSFFLL